MPNLTREKFLSEDALKKYVAANYYEQISRLELAESVILEVPDNELPDGKEYDLSDIILCRAVESYEYDSAGRLAKSTAYRYLDNNVPGLYKEGECYYTYDSQDRVSEEVEFDYRFHGLGHRERKTHDYEVTKKRVTKYDYLADGGYIKTSSLWVNHYTETQTYDRNGRLILDITESERAGGRVSTDHYAYNDDGTLCERKTTIREASYTDGHENTVETTRMEYDPENSLQYRYTWRNGYYYLWIDHLDEEQNLILSCYREDNHDPAQECAREDLGRNCYPAYFARYENGRLIEEVRKGPDRDALFNINTMFKFYDYDEAGNMTWRYEKDFYGNIDAYHYLYDDSGKLLQQIEYRIFYDTRHTLSDGTVMSLVFDYEGKISAVIRYGTDGRMLYEYSFCQSRWQEKPDLVYTVDENLETAVYWDELLADRCPENAGANGDFTVFLKDSKLVQGQEQAPAEEETALGQETVPGQEAAQDEAKNEEPEQGVDAQEGISQKETVYYVKKGDCLWKIAGELLGDNRRWVEIYRENRAAIGDDPALIFEGTELRMPENNAKLFERFLNNNCVE